MTSGPEQPSPRRRPRRALACLAGWAAVASVVASGAFSVVGTAEAAAAPSPPGPVELAQEPFTNSQLQLPAQWEAPGVPSGSNGACLTAASSQSGPLPSCGSPVATSGQGALRLTGATTSQEGGLASTLALPSSDGLDVTFDTYQYGSSSPGDGILFFLAAADPASPLAPTSLGEPGGYLAYAGGTTAPSGPGLVGGYLGVGLDAYGNFTNSAYDGTGCSVPAWAGNGTAVPDQVTVRGPGAGTEGYCLLSSSAAQGGLAGGLAGGPDVAQAGAQVPVEVAVNPTASNQTTASGLQVPPYSFVVAVTPLGAATQLVSGALPCDSYLTGSEASWLSPATGVPKQFTFGFAASTGAAVDYHEVSNVHVAPLVASPAELGVSLASSQAGTLVAGSPVTYTATAEVSSSAGAEDADPSLAVDFPGGVTPGSASGTDWSCTTSAGTVTCAYDGSLPISPGSGLPPVSIAAQVSGAASGSELVSAWVWRAGALGGSADYTSQVTSASQSPPLLGLALSDSAAGQLYQGEEVTYLAAGQVSSEGGAEEDAPSLAVSLPSSATLDSAGGTKWSCTTSAQVATCNWTGGAVAAGAALGAVSVVATVSSSATGTLDVSATLSSGDAAPSSVSATDDDFVASSPVLGLAVADGSSGDFALSSTVVYTLDASVSAAYDETYEPVVTDNFPDVFSSVTEASSSTEWDCALTTNTVEGVDSNVLTEVCTYTGPLPVGGGSLQALEFDNVVESSGQTGASADDAAAIVSSDGAVAVASDYARVGEGPAPNLYVTASAPQTAASSFSLTLDAAVLATGGPTTYAPTVTAQLPDGESFAAAPAPQGWACSLEGSTESLLSCTASTGANSAPTTFPPIEATVVPGASGLHTVQVAMSDESDGAAEVSTSSTTDVLPPVLDLDATTSSSEVSANSSYTISITSGTASSGGEAFNDFSLSASLASGESFASVPTASGWTCTLSGSGDVDLGCTYAVTSSAPVAAGTNLAVLSVAVDVTAGTTGIMQAQLALSDSADGAQSASQDLSVTATQTTALSLALAGVPSAASAGSSYTITANATVGTDGGPAYHEPVYSLTLPAGESLPEAPTPAGWDCAVPGTGGASMTCTSTASMPAPSGTSLGQVVTAVTISGTASGELQAMGQLSDAADGATTSSQSASTDVTAPPVLALTSSGTPSSASAGTGYDLELVPSIASGGPAYHEPSLQVLLPTGETFPDPVPAPNGWDCSLPSSTDLSCTSTATLPASSGSLGDVSATVEISSSATGTLSTDAQLSDGADAATTVVDSPSVKVTPAPTLELSASTSPSTGTTGNSFSLILGPSLASASALARHDPVLEASLPSGEAFVSSPAPGAAGWTCSLPSSSQLSCTSTAATPISPGSLGPVDVEVDISGQVTTASTLTIDASLADASDGAATATAEAATDVTPVPLLGLTSSGTPDGASAGTGYQLTLTPSVTSPGAPAYNDPVLTVSLPRGETFTASASSPPGWSCALSSASTVDSCTSTAFTPVGTGGLSPLSLGVTISPDAVSSPPSTTLTMSATLADTGDDATPVSTSASVTVTPVPLLRLVPSGTPASAAAPSSYTLELEPSISSAGGPAYHDPALAVALPPGETFLASSLAADGWSCSFSPSTSGVADSQLGCTSTVGLGSPGASLAPGTTLGEIGVTVDIGSSASGVLTTTATLSDNPDLATPVTVLPAVGVTSASPSFPFPELPPAPVNPTTTTLPGTTTTTGGTTTTTGPATTTPSGPTTVPGPGPGLGPQKTPVLPPVLVVKASAPATVTAGNKFTLRLTLSLAARGGPAYHAVVFSVDLPARATFTSPAPRAKDWACTETARAAVLDCTWRGPLPLPPGSHLGQVEAAVAVASSASGILVARATLSDQLDAAVPARASVLVKVLAPRRGRPGGKAPAPSPYGYRLVGNDGGVFSFGNARFEGSCDVKAKPCGKFKTYKVSGMTTAGRGNGYWLTSTNGGVYSFGGAHFYGSCPQRRRPCGKLPTSVVGIEATADARGYWLVTSTGTVYTFGDARSYGSCTMAHEPCGRLRSHIAGMARTPDGKGYWLAAADGQVFAFGDATRLGACTTSAKDCRAVLGGVTAIAASPAGKGYWLVGNRGRVFAFGSSKFSGDTYTDRAAGSIKGAVVGITALPGGAGYWLTSSYGLVVPFGRARFVGDIFTTRIKKLDEPVVGMASTLTG